MKKFFYFMVSALILCTACNDDNENVYETFPVNIQLTYPQGSDFKAVEGVEVRLTDSKGSTLNAKTDKMGKASFTVPAGIYEASVTDVRNIGGKSFIYSGVKGHITISNATSANIFGLELSESKKSQLIIKELYLSGCPKDDASGTFVFDRYVILYNNSAQPASLDNLCIGTVLPYNSYAQNNDYTGDKLIYDGQGWIPAGDGIWYFPKNVTIEPGKQIVIAINGAIDHTKTYSQSVDLSRPEYYCMYDVAVYNHKLYYPAPAATIPTSNYLSAIKYGQSKAWPLSMFGPAIFIFSTKDMKPVDFVNAEENVNYYGGEVSTRNARRKVKVEWIIDGVEVFKAGEKKNQKRLTAQVDAGYIYLEGKKGYTLYRNVDLEATKALESNKGKLVYKYDKGTEVGGKASTDPSGIDAEASIKNGARIIYKDTNNSTDDFHQRKQSSLRD